ncbi:hypothetical protein AAFC00_001286 [Neodothiora populina]|uniref:ER membrane protein complex subunit 7 beta-sandwich domain-containing protein n=1 Tax=Neodothiora populina TaxID=2781224 RepID=A0ABR3PNR5_9PEZI
MQFTTALQAALLGFCAVSEAAKLVVSIPSSPPLLPNPAALPASTHATLLGAAGQHYDARLTRSNTLLFDDLTPGSYLLDVHTRDFSFPSLRVEVSVSQADGDETDAQELIQGWQTFLGNEWNNRGASYGEQKGELLITLSPNQYKQYYQKREGFNIMGLFKNPMILMGLFSAVLIFGMPYLMDNMDEETKAEFEEMQKSSPISGSQGAAAQIQNFDLASWMAGKSGDSGASSKAPSAKVKAK